MPDEKPSRIDLDALMQRVRAEVRRRKAAAEPSERPNLYLDAPDRTARSRANPDRLPVRDAYALGELLGHSEEDFVRNAYSAVLGRPPDAEGYRHYLEALRAGALDRVEVLSRLRYSTEGRGRATRISGLRVAWAYRMLKRIPVLGYGVAWLNHLLRLPRMARTHTLADIRTRTRMEELEERLHETEHRTAVLAARTEQLEDLCQEALRLATLATELSEIALSGAEAGEDGPGPAEPATHPR